MFAIEIYGRHTCPFCVKANNILEDLKSKGKAQGIFHDMEALGLSKEVLSELRNVEVKTVPQVWVNGKHVGGCSDLVAFLATQGYNY